MGVHLIDSALFGEQFSTAAMRRVFDDAAMVRSWMQVEAALARPKPPSASSPSAPPRRSAPA
jgi:hypothetical protein